MIRENCFTEEWLDGFKKQKAHKRIDKIILEKMIYALHLLEKLKSNGSVKKGSGTLMLDILIEDSIYPEQVELPISKGKISRHFPWRYANSYSTLVSYLRK